MKFREGSDILNDSQTVLESNSPNNFLIYQETFKKPKTYEKYAES